MIFRLGTVFVILLLAGSCGLEPIHRIVVNRSADPALKMIEAGKATPTDGKTDTAPAGDSDSVSVASALKRVALGHITSEERLDAQVLKVHLSNLLRATESVQSVYTLDGSLALASTGLGYTRDGRVLRYELTALGSFILKNVANGKPVYTFSVRSSSGYDAAPLQHYATYASEKNSTDQLMRSMAEGVRLKLISYFVRHPKKAEAMESQAVNAAPRHPLPGESTATERNYP